MFSFADSLSNLAKEEKKVSEEKIKEEKCSQVFMSWVPFRERIFFLDQNAWEHRLTSFENDVICIYLPKPKFQILFFLSCGTIDDSIAFPEVLVPQVSLFISSPFILWDCLGLSASQLTSLLLLKKLPRAAKWECISKKEQFLLSAELYGPSLGEEGSPIPWHVGGVAGRTTHQ